MGKKSFMSCLELPVPFLDSSLLALKGDKAFMVMKDITIHVCYLRNKNNIPSSGKANKMLISMAFFLHQISNKAQIWTPSNFSIIFLQLGYRESWMFEPSSSTCSTIKASSRFSRACLSWLSLDPSSVDKPFNCCLEKLILSITAGHSQKINPKPHILRRSVFMDLFIHSCEISGSISSPKRRLPWPVCAPAQSWTPGQAESAAAASTCLMFLRPCLSVVFPLLFICTNMH